MTTTIKPDSALLNEGVPILRSERYRLIGSMPFDPCVIRLCGAHMLERAIPIVKSFQGDLFGDAIWMSEHVKGECIFFWGPRQGGSQIGFDHDTVKYGVELDSYYQFYAIAIEAERFRETDEDAVWYARFMLLSEKLP